MAHSRCIIVTLARRVYVPIFNVMSWLMKMLTKALTCQTVSQQRASLSMLYLWPKWHLRFTGDDDCIGARLAFSCASLFLLCILLCLEIHGSFSSHAHSRALLAGLLLPPTHKAKTASKQYAIDAHAARGPPGKAGAVPAGPPPPPSTTTSIFGRSAGRSVRGGVPAAAPSGPLHLGGDRPAPPRAAQHAAATPTPPP